MEERLKLNLGCGYAYKPGYLNIDKFDRCVADRLADVLDLPFEANSVDAIESSQLIEHFDLVHCRYLLAEWFRVLQPRGTLTIETPDLKATYKKFLSAKPRERETTLQWIYGIDSPGLQHRSGFTFDLLRHLLSETGFVEIEKREAQTHTYEPGLRVECVKPSGYAMGQFFACYRRRLRLNLKIDDSFVLIPLESWLQKVRTELVRSGSVDRSLMRRLVPLTCSCHPCVALSLLQESVASDFVKESELADEMSFLKYLAERRFHQRVFTLWIKSKKEDRAEEEFERFLTRLADMLRKSLDKPAIRYEELSYVLGLESTPIEILDICLIAQEAKRQLSLGTKAFQENELRIAQEMFASSLRMYPDNPLAFWNMARLGASLNRRPEEVARNYERAVELVSRTKIKRRILAELSSLRKGRLDSLPHEPVSEDPAYLTLQETLK